MSILEILNILQKEFPDFTWSLPPDLSLGILTTNQAFLDERLKIKDKNLRPKPNEIAMEIAQKLEVFCEKENLPLKITTIGAYLNIDLTEIGWQQFFVDNLNLVEKEGESLVKLNHVDESFSIDMFHPNVGKKTHVGHIRSGDLGECMRRILSLKYSSVVSNNFLGDWGIQFSYTTWGITHLDELDLDFDSLDLQNEEQTILVDKFYKIYVKVNQIIDEKPEVRKECQQNSKLLEKGMSKKTLSEEEKLKFEKLYNLYVNIVKLSLVQFLEAEDYLNLNKNPSWLKAEKSWFKDEKSLENLQSIAGCHLLNTTHQQGKFDLLIGESFYLSCLDELEKLVEYGLATREGEGYYVDLEEEKLGRCYIISSEGYSLYHSRDIIARIVWGGVFGLDNMMTFTDLRQEHSFKQVFCVLQKIMKAKIFENQPFGWLNTEQTKQAFAILSRKMAQFEGFGHMTLPEGAMSTRKGRIFAFEELKEMLENKVKQTLIEKGEQSEKTKPSPEKIKKLAVATLKWVDLHRDRQQDVVFDLNQFLNFIGNTGIYQLYTLARIKSIIDKNPVQTVLTTTNLMQKLNSTEILILKKIYTLPYILEKICQTYKPHTLCQYLFELATEVNSWYAKFSVNNETDLERKQALLEFCKIIQAYIWQCLELLGIEPVTEL